MGECEPSETSGNSDDLEPTALLTALKILQIRNFDVSLCEVFDVCLKVCRRFAMLLGKCISVLLELGVIPLCFENS